MLMTLFLFSHIADVDNMNESVPSYEYSLLHYKHFVRFSVWVWWVTTLKISDHDMGRPHHRLEIFHFDD